ncbi:MAG: 3-hydroxy-3-methylglutaryl-CoA reductase, partial [Paracoccaceae bacterium]
MTIKNSTIPAFRNMKPAERLKALRDKYPALAEQIFAFMGETALSLEQADGMIENVVGRFQLPLGVATNFIINEKEYLIPMAVEEPSVVA